MKEKIKLIYISGIGRNGSTLLGRVLGEHPNCVNIGEALLYMLVPTFNPRVKQHATGAGVKISESPFWEAVTDDAGFKVINESERISGLVQEFRHKELLSLIKKGDPEVLATREKIKTLIKSISKVSKCNYVIDISKRPNIPLFLVDDDDIEVYIIHLIRDATAIAASRNAPKEYLQKQHFVRICLRWIIRNTYTARLKEHFKYMVVHYEVFCENPYNFMQKVADFIDLKPFVLDELKERKITFHKQDIIASNPDKSITGTTVIKRTEKSMGLFKRIAVKIITAPWAIKYRRNSKQPV